MDDRLEAITRGVGGAKNQGRPQQHAAEAFLPSRSVRELPMPVAPDFPLPMGRGTAQPPSAENVYRRAVVNQKADEIAARVAANRQRLGSMNAPTSATAAGDRNSRIDAILARGLIWT